MNVQNTNEHIIAPTESEIGLLAYQMWEKAGRPEANDLAFWFRAEGQLRKVNKPALAASVARLRA